MADIVCTICHDPIGVDDKKEAGELNSCNHRYCHGCISAWATIENRCPCCKERFETITKKFIGSPTKLHDLAATEKLPGKVLAVEKCSEVNQRPVFEDPTFQNWIESLLCLVCGSAEHEEQLLLCDGCDCACHTYCAGLAEIPEGEWFCESCTVQRAAADRRQNQRRQREEPAARQQQQAIRRRRVTVIISDDDDDEDDKVRIVHVRSGRRDQQQRRRLDDNLDGFIVDDSEAEEELLESFEYEDDEVLEEELDLPVSRRRGRLRRGGGRQQAQRRQQQRFGQLDSDLEEEKEWKSEEEDLSLDNPRASSGDGWRRSRREPQRQRQAGGTTTTTGGGGRGFGPTAMHRAVQSVNDNWEDIRAGRVSFDQVLGRSGRGGFQIPRQSRGGSEVIDLTKSTPRGQRQEHRRNSDAGDTTGSPPLQSLSAKLRAEITACRDRGARLTPRSSQPQSTPGSAANNRWPLLHASPGSSGHRIRTVRDVHLQQEAARLTPSNGAGPSGSVWRQPQRQPINADGRSSPPPLQERLKARAQAEWGSSQLPEIPPQRPQEMPPWRERPGQKQKQQQQVPPTDQQNFTDTRPMFMLNRSSSANDNAAAGPSSSLPSSAAPSSESRKNAKARAFDAIKPYVKSYLEDDIITTDQFRLIAREATRMLYTRYGQDVDGAEEKEIRSTVDQALAAVVKNQVTV